MSNEDKLALEQNTAMIKCKLIVKASGDLPQIVLTEDNSVKSWEYTDQRLVPDKGFIGHFVSRTLNGELQNISDNFDIIGREINFQLGIVRPSVTSDNTEDEFVTTYYGLGSFMVVDPSDDDVRDSTKFESMDYTKKFNQTFNGDYTDTTFTTSYNDLMGVNTPEGQTPVVTPVTALWLAQYTCAQVGVTLATTTFRNYDFSISQNPFQAGESCRDVMKAIGQLAFSWIRIGWDDRCYIDFEVKDSTDVDTYDILDNNQYFSLEKQSVYGPINKIVVGMQNIDGESAIITDQASIAEYGEHALYVYDNPLTNTFELRTQAIAVASNLFGLEYVQLKTETIGHPWFLAKDYIDIKDMNNNHNYTYPFNTTLKYSGHIRSNVDSIGETEVDDTLGYESDVSKWARQASIVVDKQNGKITQLTGSVDSINLTENNHYQELLSTFNNYTPTSEFVDLERTVEQIQTDTYTKTEINTKLTDGSVTMVSTTTGTFDENGLTIEKTNAKTKGRFNEVGMEIMDATGSSDEELLFAGYDNSLNETVVRSKNINVTKYLSIGTHSRIEDYEGGSGIFYVG